MTPPEYRTQVKRWFVEIGVCDGGGIGHWIETSESIEVAGEAEANALRDSWLASGKLQKMPWGEFRPKTPYGLFRIRSVWGDVRAAIETARGGGVMGHTQVRRTDDGVVDAVTAQNVGFFLEQMDYGAWVIILTSEIGEETRITLATKNTRAHLVCNVEVSP